MKKARNAWLAIPVLARLALAALIGAASSIYTGTHFSWDFAPLIFWDVTMFISISALWFSLMPMNAADTRKHATSEDPGRGSADIVILIASVVSLGAVIALIINASSASGMEKFFDVGFGALSVIISWVAVHVIYTLRYADLYYKEGGSIDFHSEEPPIYQDFAYVAFTLGMTYQVSDTDFTTSSMRRVARQHALLSYVFGTAIIATTINAIAGLGK